MTPLMPVIFIMSAIVSGIALCMLTYIVTMEIRKFLAKRKRAAASPAYQSQDELKSVEVSVIQMTAKYLLAFLVAAISLEILDLIFRGYTALKSWDVLRSVIYERDFKDIFIMQYGIGNLVPLILFLIPGLDHPAGGHRRAAGAFRRVHDALERRDRRPGLFAHLCRVHALPSADHSPDWETLKEGLFGALSIFIMPFVLFWVISRIFPVFADAEAE